MGQEEQMIVQAPMDYVKELWEETHEHDWGALGETLKRREEEDRGSLRVLDEVLLDVTERLAQYGRPYPDSPQMLHDILNSEVPGGAEDEGPGGVI